MPTVIPESDAFVATIQRPNNGELADAGSISLYAQHFANSRRWLYNRTRGQIFDVTRAPFNAQPNAGADATAAIQAALDAAAPVGGHVFAPGSFRLNSALQMYPGVNLFGLPDRTFFYNNHATNDLFVWGTSGMFGSFTEVSGIHFGALVDNTGRANYNSSGHAVRVRFDNCTWNNPIGSPLLKGKLLHVDGGSIFEFRDCSMRAVTGATTELLRINEVTGEIVLDHSRFVLPAAYASQMVVTTGGRIRANDNYIDLSAYGGANDIFHIDDTSQYHSFEQNHFRGGGGSTGFCFRLATSVQIHETGSIFDSVGTYVAAGPLSLGSELSLGRPLALTMSSAGPFTCQTGYRAQSFRCITNTFSIGPTIVLPAILFEGQRFTLTVLNNSPTDWTNVLISGADVGAAALPVAIGNARSFTFSALDTNANGTLVWVIESDPTSQYFGA